MPTDLAGVQAWFQQQLTGAGPAADHPVSDVILPSRQCTADERLAVYQNAYVARLVECLAAEFPAVKQAVGDELFLQFATAHIAQHPSESYTLGQLGVDFAATLDELRPERHGNGADFADFLVDTARYERTVSEAFDAEGPEVAAASVLLPTVADGEIEKLRFHFFPCVRLLRLRFPVHEYASAVRHQQEVTSPDPRPVRLVVHRREYVVRRWEAAAWEFTLLETLMNGVTLGDAIERSASEPDVPQDFAATLFDTFAAWSRAQLFRDVYTPPS